MNHEAARVTINNLEITIGLTPEPSGSRPEPQLHLRLLGRGGRFGWADQAAQMLAASAEWKLDPAERWTIQTEVLPEGCARIYVEIFGHDRSEVERAMALLRRVVDTFPRADD